MKRYLLFVFDAYYPSGGWSDFRGDFDFEEQAREAMRTLQVQYLDKDYAQIVDIVTGSIEKWLQDEKVINKTRVREWVKEV